MASMVTTVYNYVSGILSPPYCPPLVKMPMDPDQPEYTMSFATDQVEEYQKFFDEYGFVVIRDVLSKEECKATVDEIWEYIETGAFRGKPVSVGIKRDDPKTWSDSWPSMQAEGIVGLRPVFTKQALLNRQNPKVYNAFANILGEKALMVNHDRFGLFRPTANDKGETVNAEWSTVRNVHLDMNPWVYTLPRGEGAEEFDTNSLKYEYLDDFIEENNHPGRMEDGQLHVQGLINLADNRAEDGGFHIVPGFHKVFTEWTERSRNRLGKEYSGRMTFIVLPDEDPVTKHAQRITAPAGSLFIWNQLMAHGSAPNTSNRARYAQFMKFQKAVDLDTSRGQRRKEAIGKRVERAGVELTDLGQKLFTQTPW